jgi:hypothetical protein
MKKHTFVPSADCLESRIALSGGVNFIGGVPVLTTRALNKAYGLINNAYKTFATKGLNYNLLSFNLSKAASLIPWNNRDGLRATMLSEVAGLRSNIQFHVPRPVITSYQATIQDVRLFVQDEVAAGDIVIR